MMKNNDGGIVGFSNVGVFEPAANLRGLSA